MKSPTEAPRNWLEISKEILISVISNWGEARLSEGDYERAFPSLKRKADGGDDQAAAYVGLMLFCGNGVEKNIGKSYLCLSRIKNISPVPAVFLGICNIIGDGCLRSYANARKLIYDNLHLCNSELITCIADNMFCDEQSPLHEITYAYAYYNVAASLGNNAAAQMRDKLETTMSFEAIQVAQERSVQMLAERKEKGEADLTTK